MGYLWPIAHPKAPVDDPETSRKSQDVDTEDPERSAGAVTKRRRVISKKHETATLLFYAMRTTAAQSQSQTPDIPVDVEVSTSHEIQPIRSSATPGPSSVPPQTEDAGAKSPPPGGKKKRKRASLISMGFS